MPVARETANRVACALLCATALLGSASAQAPPEHTAAAFHEGKQIVFTPAGIKRGRVLKIGDTILGPIVSDRKPNDHRPNLYVASPGTQHHAPADGIGFNLLVNTLPHTDEPVEWDVYWALVLDPTLQAEFDGESKLLMATQDGFVPGDAFTFEDLPAAALLRDYLHVDSVAGLERFRREDSTLPRVVIVPAGFAVRASAVDPDAPPPHESALSRALSRLKRRNSAGSTDAAKKP